MDINKLGTEMASLLRLMKASALYAESIRQYPIATEYKNICYSIIKDCDKLYRKVKFMNPNGKDFIDDSSEDDRVHYIAEVVLLMSSISDVEGCKEILEAIKNNID